MYNGPPNLQSRLASTNAGFFLKEFAFSRTQFVPPGGTEVELADHVVSFDNTLLVFQFKEREVPTRDPAQEEQWFKKKVVKKAVKQIRDTLMYLANHNIVLNNDRGHTQILPQGLAGLTFAKVVVYGPADALMEGVRRQKGYVSSSAGFIHFFQALDYLRVLNTLVTVPEIVDFLAYRERLCRRFPTETNALPESAVIGHYLRGVESAQPDANDERYVASLRNDIEEFQIFAILHKFKEKTYAGYSKLPDRSGSSPTDYYELLKEMLRLPRTDLAVFKERYMWAWKHCGSDDIVAPSRFASGTTGCGFVFVPLPTEANDHASNALYNLTAAAKYDLKVERCIGLVFRRDGEYRLIDWMLNVHPWEPDPELDRMFRKSYPFREAQIRTVQRYEFDE